jgi:predicted AlkP superfamily pyrophosphatase or phosphodiesterase
MVRFAPVLAATVLFASGCSYFQGVPPENRRAIVVSFDGGGERVMERMLDHGVMPNLARMRAEGAMADYSRTNFPSKTAAGHASLWTGAFGNVNGITANKVPLLPWSEHTILETTDGFSADSLQAEPLFVTAARAGKRALVLQATHGAPFSQYAPGGRFGTGHRASLTVLDGYAGVRGKEGLITDAKGFRPAAGWTITLPPSVRPAQEIPIPVGSDTLWAVAVDDPQDGVQGYDTLRLYSHKNGAALGDLKPAGDRLGTPTGWSAAVPVKTDKGLASVYLRLYELDPKLGRWMLYHTPAAAGQSNNPAQAARYYGQGAEFVNGGAIRSWESGQFGKTMFEGGDGTAEDRYLDTVAFAIETNRRRAQLAVEARDWELLVSYLPFPDEALHAWYGAVDTQSPTYNPQLAPVVWQRLETVCKLADNYLGTLMAGAGRDTVLAVGSDHGMAGLKWKYHPNVTLKAAGLLVTDARGNVDLTRTKVVYAPTDGAYVLVNRVGRKGGIVPANETFQVLRQAKEAFAAVRAHDGKPLVTATFEPDADLQAELGLGGSRGGDLYLDLRPGYYFDSDWKTTEVFKALAPGSAGHVFDPRREDMHAMQAYWGPGVKRGASVGPVQNTWLAPTVCRLLGIPAPAQATGRVVTEALE